MKSTIICTGCDTLYSSGAHVLLRPFFEGVGAILMLHHVRPPRGGAFQPNRGLEVSPEFLSQTIEWLRSEAIDIVSLDEMARRLAERDFGRRFACITFDDGYRDNRVWAYPILKAQRAPFAIYIPTSFPDRRGKLWWLALETVIAGNDSIVVTINGRESRHACARQRRPEARRLRDCLLVAARIGRGSRHSRLRRSAGGAPASTWRRWARRSA
jgi:peptidoglycan/xylan/chitin deacetylase (PgdA/CDA1 family)